MNVQTKPLTRKQAKVELKRKGWSYRLAAPFLGVSLLHLSEVLNGHRSSRILIQKITDLPRISEAIPATKDQQKALKNWEKRQAAISKA